MGCPIKLKLSEHFHGPIYKFPPCYQGGGGQGNSEKFNLSKLTIKLKKISNWLIFLSFVKKRLELFVNLGYNVCKKSMYSHNLQTTLIFS